MDHSRFAQRFLRLLPMETRRQINEWVTPKGHVQAGLWARPTAKAEAEALVREIANRVPVRTAGVVEDHFRAGKTQIFMRANVLARLDSVRRACLRGAANAVGLGYKGILARRAFDKFRRTVVALQSFARGQRTRRVLRLRIQARRLELRCRQVVDRAAAILAEVSRLQADVRGTQLEEHEAAPIRDGLMACKEHARQGDRQLQEANASGLPGLARTGAVAGSVAPSDVEAMLREALPRLAALVDAGESSTAKGEEALGRMGPMLTAAVELHDRRTNAAARGVLALGAAWAEVVIAASPTPE